MQVEGKPVARVIVDNNSCVSVDGKRIACKGDMTSHGGMITTEASSVIEGDGDIIAVIGQDVASILV